MTDQVVIVADERIILIEHDEQTVVYLEQPQPGFVLSAGEQGPPGEGTAGGTPGQLYSIALDGTRVWIDPPESLPLGGNTGEVLTKDSNADGDASWKPAASSAATYAFAARHG